MKIPIVQFSPSSPTISALAGNDKMKVNVLCY